MKKLICGILMLGTIAGVYGQKVMSLEECRLLALENNKKLKMADEQINAAKAKKEEAFTKYLPALDAMGTYMRNQKEINLLSEDAHLPVGTIGQDGKWTLGKDQIMIGADGKPVMNNGQYVPKDYALLPKEAMTVDDRNMALLQVGLTQPIYMGGKIRAYNQLAGLSEKLAESGREQELQNIIQETDEAYWQIVSLVNRQKLAVKFVETLQKFEHDIEVMYRTGVSTKAEGKTEPGRDGSVAGGGRFESGSYESEPNLWISCRFGLYPARRIIECFASGRTEVVEYRAGI